MSRIKKISYAGAGTELERAQERISELEELIGLREPIDAAPLKFRFPSLRAPERTMPILRLLSSREFISRASLIVALEYSEKSERLVDVYLSFARQFCAGHGIEIENVFGEGWKLKADDRARLRTVLGVAQ